MAQNSCKYELYEDIVNGGSQLFNQIVICNYTYLANFGSFCQLLRPMPSPSASSKFGLSTLKFFKHTQFLKYPQNNFGILKSEILLHKLAHLSIPKTF